MSPYKGILLDLDNTLYDYTSAHLPAVDAAMQYLAGELKKPVDELRRLYEVGRKKFNTELDGTAASHNRLLYFQHLLESLRENPLPHALEAYNLYWDTYNDHIVLFEGVSDFFGNNADKTFVIVTDLTADVQYKKIREMGLCGQIDFIVTSEEVGVEKPSPAIFKAALSKANFGPEEVCMIGDSYERDIAGAQYLGIQSFWLNRGREKRQLNAWVEEIHEFKQLLELI